MFNKNFIEKKIKKNGNLKVYSPDNIPLTIAKESYLLMKNTELSFDMDCEDLASYSNSCGMTLSPNKN